MIIPKIIHQIWSSKQKPLPPLFKKWGMSWELLNPNYQYICWDDNKISFFLSEYYSDKKELLSKFPYDIQQWDILKYLILFVYGGIYVDFDSECVRNLTPLMDDDKPLYFTSDPHYSEKSINNSFIASVPKNDFISYVIDYCFEQALYLKFDNRVNTVLNTTGPKMLNYLYEEYPFKDQIKIIHYKYTSPITQVDSCRILKGSESPILHGKLREAFVIHYFSGTWVFDELIIDCRS